MKLALIPPTSLLEDTSRTDMQLMLPQLAISDSHYAKFYRKHCKNKHQYVILDNGAAERSSVNLDTLMEMIYVFQPDEFAIPDSLGDSRRTLVQANYFFARYEQNVVELNQMKLGFVAQGRTIMECFDTVTIMAESWWADYIQVVYLPRLLVAESGDAGARLELASLLNKEYGGRFELHLFGAAPMWPAEIRAAADLSFIRSMDTSLPYVMSYWNTHLDMNVTISKLTRPSNYFDQPWDKFTGSSAYVNTFIAWAEGLNHGHSAPSSSQL